MSTEKPSPPSPTPKRGVGRVIFLLLSPILGAIAGILVAGIFAYITPKKYESTCVVQIHPRAPGLNVFGSGMADPPGNFLATELKVIQSDATLKLVVERLDLPTRWKLDPAETARTLQGMVSTKMVPGTDLVRIVVRHGNPEEARDLAEAIAGAYVERRNSLETKRAELALAALNSELLDQEDLVEEKRKILYVIAQNIGIPHHQESDADPAGHEFSLGAERELYKLEKELQELKVRLEMLQKLEGDELFKYAAALSVPQNGVAAMLEVYETELEHAKELMVSGVGPNHPRSQAQADEIAEAEGGVAEAVETLRLIVQTQLELSEARLVKMRGVVDERRDLAVKRALESADYVEAKQDYENARAMLVTMEKMRESSRIALKIPRLPVTIHEEPKVGRAPVSPKVGLTLAVGSALGMVGGFLIGVLVFFLPVRR